MPSASAADLRLVNAVKNSDRAAVTSLLQQKVDVNSPEADGTTALHWAVRADDLDTADRLIKAGANAKTANRYGITPLYLASVNGSAPMIEKLLKAGADANEVSNRRRNRADDCRANGQRRCREGAAGQWREGRCERNMAGADGIDVGRRAKTSGHGEGTDRPRCRRQRAVRQQRSGSGRTPQSPAKNGCLLVPKPH